MPRVAPKIGGLTSSEKDPLDSLIKLMSRPRGGSPQRLRAVIAELEEIAESDPRIAGQVTRAIDVLEGADGRELKRSSATDRPRMGSHLGGDEVKTPI